MSVFRACLAPLLAVVAAAAGCATRPFDRHFEAGRYAEAVRSFDTDSSLHRDERALFRAAVAHALPASAAYQPQRARALLNRLLALHPGGAHAREATRLLAVVDELARLSDESRRLRRQVDSLERRIAEIHAARRSLEVVLERERHQADVLRALAERLDADLRRAERRLAALREDLRRLKEVDLQPNQPGGRPRTSPPAPGARPAPDTTQTQGSAGNSGA